MTCNIIQGRVYQGKEPPQFVAIFQPMLVLKVPIMQCNAGYCYTM